MLITSSVGRLKRRERDYIIYSQLVVMAIVLLGQLLVIMMLLWQLSLI